MAQFETLSLPAIYGAAEQIKNVRRQSRLDDLREIATRQQIDSNKAEMERADRTEQTNVGLLKAKAVDTKAGYILNAPDAKSYISQNEPALIGHLGTMGVDFNTADEPTIRQAVESIRTHAREALGIGPEPTLTSQKVGEFDVLRDSTGKVLSSKGPSADSAPNSVREFQFAKQNGFAGSFKDWVTAGGQSSRPSSVQEWDFYDKLSQAQKLQYLEMKRNPNMQVKDVNQVPTVVAPSVVGGTTQTPLSTLPSEASAAGTIKQAEAQGGAVGKAEGEITGGIQTKGANAVGTTGLLDIADPLIDVATGSTAGAARDAVAGFFGKATSGAEAIAQLKVLQAGLMTSMPRMEGPQSDRDVMLYREAAGQIGDPSVPAPLKKAAAQTVRQLQQKYIQRAQQTTAAPVTAQPAATGALGVGQSTTVGGFTVTRKK